jgi:hypothetical protein
MTHRPVPACLRDLIASIQRARRVTLAKGV